MTWISIPGYTLLPSSLDISPQLSDFWNADLTLRVGRSSMEPKQESDPGSGSSAQDG